MVIFTELVCRTRSHLASAELTGWMIRRGGTVPEQRLSDIARAVTRTAWVYVPLALALAGFAAVAVRSDRDFSFYWRDPAAIVNTGPWIGLFSNIGIFIWRP